MGVELRPVFQPTLADVAYRSEGKALVDDLETLEDIAAEHGITPLSAFMESSGEDFEAGDDLDGDRTWFSAEDGMCAVRSLLEALENRSTQDLLSDAETILNDLEELARCLEAAVSRKAKFRLAVG
jgi:hypothetical protein